MAVTLYFDHNFSGPIIRQLRRRDITLVTAWEDQAAAVPDPTLLDRATALGCPLVTGDRDLLAEAARRQRTQTSFAGVIYCHERDQVFVGPRVAELELIARAGDPADFTGLVWRLPLQ